MTGEAAPHGVGATTRASGRVTAFDAHVGLGEVTPDGGGPVVMFHCVEIADGSRSIEVGAAVHYRPALKFGHTEAFDLRPAEQ